MKAKRKISDRSYAALVPVIAKYRKYLMEACGIKTGRDYNTIYTEKRVYGARSKFWYSSFSKKQVQAVKNYIQKHPEVVVFSDGKSNMKWYAVDFVLKPVIYNAYGRPTQGDYQLVFTVNS